MNCPKCGNPAVLLKNIQMLDHNRIPIKNAQVYQCNTCKHWIPYPSGVHKNGTNWPFEFAVLKGRKFPVRPPASEFN